MEKFQTISPIDESVYVERDFAGAKQIEETLERATRAQKDWAKKPLQKKISIMQKFMQYFRDHQLEIAKEITQQMGRPIKYTPGEVNGLLERSEYMIQIAESALADITPSAKEGFNRFIRREPIGVVCIIAPWNYPYLTAINAIIPALLAGNTVILKHSTQTPLCAERLKAAFEFAGLPDGVFNYLHLTHQDTEVLIQDSRIGFVAFTGSVSGGERIQQTLCGRFIGYTLELGGKDPAYVREDAPLNFTIENLVDGAFFNSGQSCCGIERIYVAKSLFQDFVHAFVEKTQSYLLDNPLDPKTTLGPLVSQSSADFVREQIAEAISQGATPLINEKKFIRSQIGTPYLAPQVLIDVNHHMRLMTEENFGPVVGIMSVEDDVEALKLMNDSPYGLTASVWTQDQEAALQLGTDIQTGTWFMNRCDYLDPALVWTGVKKTGHGASLSILGYEQLTQPKSYHLRLKTN